jgi:quercetin dioxygenase-like cupin family protein
VFTKSGEDGYQTVAPGIRMRTLCFGSATLMSEFRLLHGNDLPRHAHPHEQTGYLVSGHITLQIGDETHDVVPGDSWCIPGGAEHGAKVLRDSVAVEVFSPVREDYLPRGAEADRRVRGDDAAE